MCGEAVGKMMLVPFVCLWQHCEKSWRQHPALRNISKPTLAWAIGCRRWNENAGWFRVENTHEAIISKQVFEQVQEQIANRRRQQKDATTQIFSGLVKCADCGWSMRFGTNRQNSKPYSHYTCSQYGQGLKRCSSHYIRYDYLYHYVLLRVQDLWRQAQVDEQELLHRLLKGSEQELAANAKRQSAELTRAEKRRAEVDRKFAKLYEDWSYGRITEYNFSMLSGKYQSAQAVLLQILR